MEEYLATVKRFAGGFAPQGFRDCDGQLLPINQNQALFAILGTTYGGNGTTNFALPNLRGRVPIGWGQGNGLSPFNLGQTGGEAAVTLQATQPPVHSHGMAATTNSASAGTPAAGLMPAEALASGRGGSYAINTFASGGAQTSMPLAVSSAGGNQPHNNLQPSLVVNYCIALQGIFPSRN